MPNKMLIDSSHPEETRVVVLRGNRVEEFDFESADKKQLRGNIYLAKVTRVEPSLQAAFVDYGGNRHGFLAFPEIHPDYYQIPVVDRQALIDDEVRAQHDEDEEEQRAQRRSRRFRHNDRGHRRVDRRRRDDEARGEAVVGEISEATAAAGFSGRGDEDEASRLEQRMTGEDLSGTGFDQSLEPEMQDDGADADQPRYAGFAEAEGLSDAEAAIDEGAANEDEIAARGDMLSRELDGEGAEDAAPDIARLSPSHRPDQGDVVEIWPDEGQGDAPAADGVEQLGGDAMEEVPVHRHRYRKQYKIQEVIKRRQILLVQVVKEERGNKGAALTTYLSLAGRYSVLMPNTARGGGISRKITDATDRQRLKSIVQELEVPEGMGVILRTAGAARTKAEVKRDFEYLLRMWETVRETTLRSTAPTLVYEEGSLIKRAIRDLYNKDIDEVVVAGEEGYREAKEFMRLLMPSHAKNIQPYRDPQPLFAKQGVEAQLDAMFSNQVTLKSGGYIVINQTEALVAIDVNSGRSTREHNIEDTALRTNLEAVDEIARQLRLRDLAGLIVLDLIDMEESRNNRAVERRLKEALKNDRARIQVGTISHFGLLEMSRQRIRSGVLEASTVVCPHCAGSGTLRSTASIALHILRVIEDALIKNASYDITVKARTIVALYILNQKRAHLRALETRFGAAITIEADDSLTGPTYYLLERGELASGQVEPMVALPAPGGPAGNGATEAHLDDSGEVPEAEMEAEGVEAPMAGDETRDPEAESEGRARRRRRRRRGRGGDREISGIAPNAPQPPDDALGAIARFGGLEGQISTDVVDDTEALPEAAFEPVRALEPEVIFEVEPEKSSPVTEATVPTAEPVDRRRSRKSTRAKSEPAEAPAPEISHDFEAKADAAPQSSEPGVEAESGAEEVRPARPRRRRRTTKAREQEELPETTADAGVAAESADAPEEPKSGLSASPALTGDIELPSVPPQSLEVPEAGPEVISAEVSAAEASPAEASPAETGPAEAGREVTVATETREDRPKRSGWWQRAKASAAS